LFGGVNRPQLNAFVAGSQAKNGLVSAQTQDALIKAQQEIEKQDALHHIRTSLVGMGAPESDADLATDFIVGSNNNDPVTAMKALSMAKLGYSNPQGQVAGQQMYEGKVAPPVSVPNDYIMPPGSGLSGAPVQQSPQGAAQTAQTQAVTGLDVARAEEEHAKAKNALSPVGGLSPASVDEAARVTMADPTKMTTYAGFGASGQTNKNQINNRRAELLNQAGMTPDDMIRQRAITKANVGSTAQAAKQAETLDAFMPLMKANSQRIQQLLDNIDATGGTPDEPIVNGFSRLLGRQLGDSDLAELHSLFTSYQAEVARLLAAGPSMNGVISDHARSEVQGMAPENMSSAQARRVLNRVDLETGIRRQGVEQALHAGAEAQLPVISLPKGGTSGAPLPPPVAAPPAGGGAGLPPGLTLVN
jgi:hypothetical protein